MGKLSKMYFIGTAIPADEHILEHLQRPWRWDRGIKTGVDTEDIESETTEWIPLSILGC